MTVHTSAKGTQHETVYMYTAYCNSVQCNTSLSGTYDTISMAVHKHTHTHTTMNTYTPTPCSSAMSSNTSTSFLLALVVFGLHNNKQTG